MDRFLLGAVGSSGQVGSVSIQLMASAGHGGSNSFLSRFLRVLISSSWGLFVVENPYVLGNAALVSMVGGHFGFNNCGDFVHDISRPIHHQRSNRLQLFGPNWVDFCGGSGGMGDFGVNPFCKQCVVKDLSAPHIPLGVS